MNELSFVGFTTYFDSYSLPACGQTKCLAYKKKLLVIYKKKYVIKSCKTGNLKKITPEMPRTLWPRRQHSFFVFGMFCVQILSGLYWLWLSLIFLSTCRQCRHSTSNEATTAYIYIYIYIYTHTHTHTYIYIYRVSQEECARLRGSVPYVKVYRYNPKHLYPKLNGYGDNGQRNVGASCGSKYCNLHSWYVTWQC